MESSGAFAGAVVFLDHFEDLADPRQRGKVVYPLDEVLLLCLLAVLAGADSIVDIARFGDKKRDLLRRFRPFSDGTPSHDQLGTILAVDNHVLPALGAIPVGAVEREHVTALHYKMRGQPHAANAVLKIVAKMFSLAEGWGLRASGRNPCRSVRKYKTRPRERFLTDAEFGRLGRALDEAEAEGAVSLYAAAAIRLLVLTGCRRNEILELRWDDVDPTAGELRLRDTKTGARMVN